MLQCHISLPVPDLNLLRNLQLHDKGDRALATEPQNSK